MTRNELGDKVFDKLIDIVYISPKDRIMIRNDLRHNVSVGTLKIIKKILEVKK